MTDYSYRPEVEILSVTDTGRRRRWTDEEKLRTVDESFGGRVAETARRHDIGRTLLMRWRRQYREFMLVAATEDCPRFTPLVISPKFNS
jgi:transposase